MVLELHSGPESDTLNSETVSARRNLRLGGLACWAQKEGVAYLKSHSECEQVVEPELDPQAPTSQLGSPSFAPLPAGRRLHQCWLPRPRKTHFFPLSSQRKQNGSAVSEEPMPAGGPSTRGPGMWLPTGQGSCQSPKSNFILRASKGTLGTCRPLRSALPASRRKREEAGVGAWGKCGGWQ